MKRAEIIEEYWQEFLRDCHFILITHGAHETSERSKATPTDSNFWLWYLKNKMTHDDQRINDFLNEDNDKV